MAPYIYTVALSVLYSSIFLAIQCWVILKNRTFDALPTDVNGLHRVEQVRAQTWHHIYTVALSTDVNPLRVLQRQKTICRATRSYSETIFIILALFTQKGNGVGTKDSFNWTRWITEDHNCCLVNWCQNWLQFWLHWPPNLCDIFFNISSKSMLGHTLKLYV